MGTGTFALLSTSSATTNRLTKLYPPTVATASTICLSLRNLCRLSNTPCGTLTDSPMKSAKTSAACNSGVSDVFGVAPNGGVSRISRSCSRVRPTLAPTGSCWSLCEDPEVGQQVVMSMGDGDRCRPKAAYIPDVGGVIERARAKDLSPRARRTSRIMHQH